CIRYRDLPNTKWFEIDLFKKLMGVPADKYEIFRDFKKRVLDKAIQEVNTYSDMVITAEYVKEGRRVVRLRFTLKERAKRMRLGIAEPKSEIEHSDLKTKLDTIFGLLPEQIEQLCYAYDTKFIEDKIALVESSKPYQEGTIQNLGAYLMSA